MSPLPRPLARPDFRALLLGHSITILGFWVFFTTLFTQMTFRLDASAGQLALLTALLTLPVVGLVPFTGLLVDRFGAWGCLLLSYGGSVVAVVTAALVVDSIPELYVLGVVMAAISALLRPSVFGLMSRVVPGGMVSAAQGLVIAGQEAGLVIGPLATALLFARGAEPRLTYLVSGIGYFAGLLVVRARVPRPPLPPRRELAGLRDRLYELAAGVRSVRGDPPRVVATACILCFFAFVGVLLAVQPVFLRDELGAGRSTLSLVLAVDGVGSCGAALWASRRPPPRHPVTHLGRMLAVLGVVVLVWSRAPSVAAALPMNLAIGVCFGLFFVPAMALIQGRTPVPVAGRVIAVVAVGQQVSQGLVALLAGGLATRHVRGSLAASGLLLVAAGAVAWATQRVRVAPPAPEGSPHAEAAAGHPVEPLPVDPEGIGPGPAGVGVPDVPPPHGPAMAPADPAVPGPAISAPAVARPARVAGRIRGALPGGARASPVRRRP